MTNMAMASTDDPFDLNRFIEAQEPIYADVIAELPAGRKQSHWMWFIFPQIDGLGFSATSRRYSIKSLAEAKAYLGHAVLGVRLLECARIVLELDGRTALEVFGRPDDMKLHSSMTLFSAISPRASVFSDVLGKYFSGARDRRTIELIELIVGGTPTK